MTYNNLAMATDDHREAEAFYQQALEIRKELVEQSPTNNFFRRNLARTYQNLAVKQRELGRPEDALKSFEECRRLLEQVVIEQPAVTVYQHDLGQILNHHGNALADRRQYDEGKDLLQRSRAIFLKLRHASPGDTSFAAGVHDAEKALTQLEKDSKPSQATAGGEGMPQIARRPTGDRVP